MSLTNLADHPRSTESMVRVPGGTTLMGSDSHYPEEAPALVVTVGGFWMDPHPVTNAQFNSFVTETGYRTVAETPPKASAYPGALPELLYAGSIIFVQPEKPVNLSDWGEWWNFMRGADWRHPHGPDSSTADLDHHPVVHIAYQDAVAFAAWAKKELPTETEWEFACRGGLEGAEYAWGNELMPDGRVMANYWQGEFPVSSLASGYGRTSPVMSFPANGYGLFDLIGNVWEWTSDRYGARNEAAQPKHCCKPRDEPERDSFDPARPGTSVGRKVLKGGSHLCAENYCIRFRPAARLAQPVDTSTSHVGFRCIVRG